MLSPTPMETTGEKKITSRSSPWKPWTVSTTNCSDASCRESSGSWCTSVRMRLACARNGVTTPIAPLYPCSTISLRTSATTASASVALRAPPPAGRITLPRTSTHRTAGPGFVCGRFKRFVIGGDAQAAAIEMLVGKRDDVAVRAVMIAQVDDVLVAAQAARQIEQRVHRVGPGGASLRQSVRRQNQPILLRRHRADVLELQRVADDHGARARDTAAAARRRYRTGWLRRSPPGRRSPARRAGVRARRARSPPSTAGSSPPSGNRL